MESSRECYVKIVKTRPRFAASFARLDFSSLESVAMHESEASRRGIFKDRRWPHQWSESSPVRSVSALSSPRPRWRKQKRAPSLLAPGNRVSPMTSRPWPISRTFQSFSFSVSSPRSYYCTKLAIECKIFFLLLHLLSFCCLIINICSFGNIFAFIYFLLHLYIFTCSYDSQICADQSETINKMIIKRALKINW